MAVEEEDTAAEDMEEVDIIRGEFSLCLSLSISLFLSIQLPITLTVSKMCAENEGQVHASLQ